MPMKKYKHLNYDQRCQIRTLIKAGYSQTKIANVLKVNQSTISREIKRNKTKKGKYNHKQANDIAIYRRQCLIKSTISNKYEKQIKHLLKKKYSPEQISGYLKRTKNILISHTSIYRYIWKDKNSGGSLYKNLRRSGKPYKYKGKTTTRGIIKNRVSIHSRPSVVNEKTRFGDWEIDLIIGKNHSGALVTIVDRKTKFTLSAKIDNKSAKAVTKATIRLLKPFKNQVLTITEEYGKEFAYHEKIASALDAKFYFADPYSSYQRGLNENTNGLIRQYFPKKIDFKNISCKRLSACIKQLNNRPRKILGFYSPYDIMSLQMSKLAS